jgi:hypothetical protein
MSEIEILRQLWVSADIAQTFQPMPASSERTPFQRGSVLYLLPAEDGSTSFPLRNFHHRGRANAKKIAIGPEQGCSYRGNSDSGEFCLGCE